MERHIFESPLSKTPESIAAREWIKRETKDEEGHLISVGKRRGLDIAREITKLKGPFIEVAGPSDERDFIFYDVTEKGGVRPFNAFALRKVYVSNLYEGHPTREGGTAKLKGRKVDFIGDATKMSLEKESVDGVFCSYIGTFGPEFVRELEKKGFFVPKQEKLRSAKEIFSPPLLEENRARRVYLRRQVIEEAWRVLRPGGFLFWNGLFEGEVGAAEKRGFVNVQYQKHLGDDQKAIFMKEAAL